MRGSGAWPPSNWASAPQRSSNTTGSTNVGIANAAGINLTTGSNNIDILNPGLAGETGQIRIGTQGTQTGAFLAGVTATPIAGPTLPVVIKANGQLGTGTAAAAAPAARRDATAPGASGDAGARELGQQRQIDELAKQNRDLAAQVAELRALVAAQRR